MSDFLCIISFPWLIICRIFDLGKFTNWITDYPQPEDEDYGIEPWQSMGVGNQCQCDRKHCPYKCTMYNH